MSKTYEIKTLRDILDIPTDKMDAFLVDLKMWHSSMSATLNLLDATVEATKPDLDYRTEISHMRWIDDGKHDGKIIISTPSPEVHSEVENE